MAKRSARRLRLRRALRILLLIALLGSALIVGAQIFRIGQNQTVWTTAD